jgi:hypothetical protein
VTLPDAQTRFLHLHVHHLVTKWTAHFKETILKATTERGRHAYICQADLAELFAAGLMETGPGQLVRATPAGRAYMVKQKEPAE